MINRTYSRGPVYKTGTVIHEINWSPTWLEFNTREDETSLKVFRPLVRLEEEPKTGDPATNAGSMSIVGVVSAAEPAM